MEEFSLRKNNVLFLEARIDIITLWNATTKIIRILPFFSVTFSRTVRWKYFVLGRICSVEQSAFWTFFRLKCLADARVKDYCNEFPIPWGSILSILCVSSLTSFVFLFRTKLLAVSYHAVRSDADGPRRWIDKLPRDEWRRVIMALNDILVNVCRY